MLKSFNVRTNEKTCMIDITSQIMNLIKDSGVEDGLCMIFIPHTTAGVTINENADPDVKLDMIKAINKLVPFEDGYRHLEGNSAAHIKASLFGFSEQIVIKNNDLLLGTWQGVYFCEFDGGRDRTVHVKIIEG